MIKSAPPPVTESSLFQRSLDLLNAVSPLRASFDDFTGVTLDYPQLFLPVSHQIHSCTTCQHAKSTDKGQQDCALNKHVTNRLAIRGQGRGFSGVCHLGLFDIVEPLKVRNTVLGVFYYGSVVIREREAESRQKVLCYCKRRRMEPSPYLEAWKTVPRISEAGISAHQDRLHTLAESARLWCEALAIPVERYPQLIDNVYWVSHRTLPSLVRAAHRFVARRFDQTCRVEDIAAYAGCHPNYLSTEFKRHTGQTLTRYVQGVRISRAKAMLIARQLSVGEIAYQCGFADPSHFVRVFRLHTGRTPKTFQSEGRPDTGP